MTLQLSSPTESHDSPCLLAAAQTQARGRVLRPSTMGRKRAFLGRSKAGRPSTGPLQADRRKVTARASRCASSKVTGASGLACNDEATESAALVELGSPTDKDLGMDVGSNVAICSTICGGSRPHLIGAWGMILPPAAGTASFLIKGR